MGSSHQIFFLKGEWTRGTCSSLFQWVLRDDCHILVHEFSDSFKKYLVHTSNIPGTVLGAKDSSIYKTKSLTHGTHFLAGSLQCGMTLLREFSKFKGLSGLLTTWSKRCGHGHSYCLESLTLLVVFYLRYKLFSFQQFFKKNPTFLKIKLVYQINQWIK